MPVNARSAVHGRIQTRARVPRVYVHRLHTRVRMHACVCMRGVRAVERADGPSTRTPERVEDERE